MQKTQKKKYYTLTKNYFFKSHSGICQTHTRLYGWKTCPGTAPLQSKGHVLFRITSKNIYQVRDKVVQMKPHLPFFFYLLAFSTVLNSNVDSLVKIVDYSC